MNELIRELVEALEYSSDFLSRSASSRSWTRYWRNLLRFLGNHGQIQVAAGDTTVGSTPSRFDDVHETLAKARAYLETGGWTKVEDGLPVVPEGLDHVEIFFFCAQDSGRRVGRRLWLDVDTALSHGITHWRYAEPTPEPPKG